MTGRRWKPWARATARVPAARATSRTTSVTDSLPTSKTPAIAAHAVAPLPRTTTSAMPAAMLGKSRTCAARRAPAMPSTSVQSATQPPSRGTSVLAAPTRRARGVTLDASSRAARLPGIVTDRPAHDASRAATQPGSSSAVHSTAS